jgi:hypothetical protein
VVVVVVVVGWEYEVWLMVSVESQVIYSHIPSLRFDYSTFQLAQG